MNPSTQLARAVVQRLADAGVRDVVLCPGSRSAPLAYALHAADGAGVLRLHVRHDERAAGFTALGLTRGGDGAPAVVVTTSGTAVANLHPAVLEASAGGVPLLVLTADRPHPLRGTWANQTTELQAGLFGAAVRQAVDLRVVGDAADVGRAVDSLGVALAAATGDLGGRPGPVHVDVAFDDPLVPDDDGPAARTVAAAPPAAAVVAEPTSLEPGPRTVVVAGDAAGRLAGDLAARAGWPLLAEPTSGAGRTGVPAYRLLLGDHRLGGTVERAVVLGRPTLSRPVQRLLAREDVEVVQVVRHPDEPGPARDVHRVVGPVMTGPADGGEWLRAWTSAGAAARAAVDAVLDGRPDLTGPLVAREVARATPDDGTLVVAASNPVRDLDLVGADLAPGARVLANRGLSGIDGTLSTASGVALAAGRRVRALVGDLAFLHDLNGLLLGPAEPEADLQVVVVNDDGGGIFGLLEHGDPRRAAVFERVFGTPHGVDLGALSAGFGAPYRRVADVRDLRSALAGKPRGRSVVEVRADRSALRDLHAQLTAAVAKAVAGSADGA